MGRLRKEKTIVIRVPEGLVVEVKNLIKVYKYENNKFCTECGKELPVPELEIKKTGRVIMKSVAK